MGKRGIFLILILVLFIIYSGIGLIQATEDDNSSNINSFSAADIKNISVGEEINAIVVFKDNINETLLENKGADIKNNLESIDTSIITADKKTIQDIQNNSNIESIEPDINIELFGEGSNITINSQIIPWGIGRVNAPSAWDKFSGKNVKIAVIDSGINRSNPDLKNRIKGGISFVNGTSYWDDEINHGTSVAGVIAASNNKIGVVGVAPDSDIYSVKVIGASGGKLSDVIQGIQWAIDNHMDIIVMSLGISVDSPSLKKIVDEAYDNGIILVAASGKDGQLYYPAKYASVIAVGSIDENNQLTSDDGAGEELEFVAPGRNIISTSNDGYSSFDGTSMAAPHVAGIAALIKEENTLWTNNEIRAKLQRDAIDLGDKGKDNYFGYGLVNFNTSKENLNSTLQIIFPDDLNETNFTKVEIIKIDNGKERIVQTLFYNIYQKIVNISVQEGIYKIVQYFENSSTEDEYNISEGDIVVVTLHAGVVHGYITAEAMNIWSTQEILNYANIIESAAEDEPGPGGILSVCNHFWNPDSNTCSVAGCIGNFYCNPDLAQIYFNNAVYYYNSDKQSSYQNLGWAIHLLEDMSVPAHVNLDSHLLGDSYESYMKTNYGNYNSNGLTYSSYSNLHAFYVNMAEMSDNYDSNGANGEVDNGARRSCFLGICTISDPNCKIIGDTLMPAAMSNVAGLYRFFWVQTHNLNYCTSGSCCDTSRGITIQSNSAPGWTDYNFCSNNDVYNRHYYCQGIDALASNQDSLVQDCGVNSFTDSANYCKDSRTVYKNTTNYDRGCSAGNCLLTVYTFPVVVQSCNSTQICSNGICICSPNITNQYLNNWTNLSCLANDRMNQSITFIQYDANLCSTSNKTITQYRATELCDYCNYSVSTTITDWANLSCLKDDSKNQSRVKTEYDSNYSKCYAITHLSSDLWNNGQNRTYTEYQQLPNSCDYCSYNVVNTSWSNWQNQSQCSNDIILQNQSRIEYDSNYSKCYAITHLSSDLWNNGQNNTYWNYSNWSYDCCIPNIVNTPISDWANIENCRIDDTQNQSRLMLRYDKQFCLDHNIQNQTFYEYKMNTCNYCSYDIKTISTEWQNDSCLITDSIKQKRTNITFDSNYSTCYSITHLASDLWNNGQNSTVLDYQELARGSCNYCSYNVVNTSWSNWQNQSQCSNDIILQNQSRIEYDSNYSKCYAITHLSSDLWNNGQNNTYWNYSNWSYDCCVPKIINSTSDWENISCSKEDILNKSRKIVQYDSNFCLDHNISNQTFYEYATGNCSYCSANIQGPFNTSWSSCSDKGIKTRMKYYVDLNYASCCAVTGLDSDCLINTQTYQNITETSTDGCLIVNSPIDGKIYNKTSILFGISSTSLPLYELFYSDNSAKESQICTNCYGYFKTRTLTDGNHTLLFRVLSSDGKEIINKVNLFIDSHLPQISITKPIDMQYTNGSGFYIKYSEDYCKSINLIINGTLVKSDPCKSGKYMEKNLFQNLSAYDNQIVSYKFKIIDIANNTRESYPRKIKVDTTAPEIKDFKAQNSSNYITFNMRILNENEKSFDRVEYLDNSVTPVWKPLCTSLSLGNICSKKLYFKAGNHNIIVRVKDKAGNSDSESVSVKT